MATKGPQALRALMDPTAPPTDFEEWAKALPRDHGIGHGKFTAARRALIVGSIARTGSVEIAARCGGLTTRGMRKWLTKGRDDIHAAEENDRGPDEYGEFFLQCLSALGWWQSSLIALLRRRAFDHGETQWAAWMLSRLGGKLASERIELDLETGTSGDSAQDVLTRITAKLEAIKQRRAMADVPDLDEP